MKITISKSASGTYNLGGFGTESKVVVLSDEQYNQLRDILENVNLGLSDFLETLYKEAVV